MEDVEFSGTIGSSTDALISPEYTHSTGSLVHKDFSELLQKSNVIAYEEENTSSILGNGNNVKINVNLQDRRNDDDYNVRQPEKYFDQVFGKLSTDNNHGNNDNADEKGYTYFNLQPNGLEDPIDIQKRLYGNVNNPIMLRLYNMIQVFLLRHGLTLDFLSVFQRYITLLNEADMNPLEDKYLLTLQNELSKGYEFSNTLQEIITAFLLEPENVIMKLANFQFKNERLLLKRVFSGWRLKYSLNYNLAELEEIWGRYVKKKFYDQWVQTLSIKTQQWPEDADQFYEQKLKTECFNRLLGSMNQLATKSQIADNFFLDNTFAKIKSKHERLHSSSNNVIQTRNKLLLANSLRSWKLKMCKNHFNPIAIKRHLQAKYLTLWKLQYRHNRHLSELSVISERTLALRPCLKIWLSRFRNVESYRINLYDKSDLFTKSRYFRTITSAYTLAKIKSKVQDVNSRSLQKHFLMAWKKRVQERSNCIDIISNRNEKLLGMYFTQWKNKCDSYVRADSQYTDSLKKRFLKKIRLKARLLQSKSNINRSMASKCLEVWNKKFQLNILCKEYDQLVLQRYYKVISTKRQSLKDLGDLSARCYNNDITKRFFILWKKRFENISAKNQKCDAFIKLRFIALIKRGILNARMKDRLSIELAKKYDQQHLDKFWVLWKSHLNSKRMMKLNTYADVFEERRDEYIKRKYVQVWRKRYDFYSMECMDIALDKYDLGVTIRSLEQWKTRYSNIQLMYKEADGIYDNTTLSNAFDMILQKMDNLKLQNSKLVLYVEEKQAKLLLKWTNQWSMKMMKLKRNEESVQVFRARWNRANMRAIMSLWKEKTFSYPNSLAADDIRNISSQKEDIAFQTPMKPLDINSNGFTTIPGSERIKRNKMDRIKNRFSRARGAIPSPIKSTQILDSTAKTRLAGTEYNQTQPLQNSTDDTPHITGDASNLSLLNVNKRLAGKTKSISFNRIPHTTLFGFPSPQSAIEPSPKDLTVDLDFLDSDSLPERDDDSPTKRRARPH